MPPIPSQALTPADFDAVGLLMDQMLAWDIATTRAVTGTDAADLIATYYPESRAALRAAFARPGAAIFLARDARGTPLGCLGFGPLEGADGTVAEVQKFFVAEAARGQGAGRALLAVVLQAMARSGYRRAVLETSSFMQAAIALYRAAGFEPCPPFRPALDALSLFLGRDLAKA